MKEDRIESYCTTGQFGQIGNGYKRHCGPTAMTNIVLTLRPKLADPARIPGIFEHIARIGQRRLTYWNDDFFGMFGGTSDVLARLYLPAVLWAFHIKEYRVVGPFPFVRKRLLRELDRESILFLEVHRHPKYGAHHLVCYGYKQAGNEILLKVADGWVGEPVYLPITECRLGLFMAVRPR